MLLSNSSQVFELNKRSTFQIPTPVLTEDITLPLEWNGKVLKTQKIFPTRVELGEVLLFLDEFPILSPVEGIAELDSTKNRLKVRLDGKLYPKSKYTLQEFSFSEFSTKLQNLGVISLDFVPNPIYKLFQNFKDSENSLIVFAPYTENNFINFQARILEKHKSEFQALVENIRKFFPKSKLYNFFTDSKSLKNYSYPEGNPNYFLSKYCNLPFQSKPNFSNVLYLGPETIYVLIQALYYSLPFVERLVSVHVINQNGFLEGEPKIYQIKNGTNLTAFFSLIREKYAYKYFTVNSFFEKNPVYEIGAEFYFDIYSYNSFIICEVISSSHRERLCIDCNDCNYFCPVNAKPRELLNKNSSGFQTENCIECGLCSVFCPSHIDFTRRIQEQKGGFRFALS